jgi:large subunit ribosomal protein L17
MRKRVAFRQLSRTSSHKWAMLRNMVTSLIKHERIVTTVPKAKELKRLADHMVTLAKSNGRPQLQSIQDANRIIREKPVLTKLFQVLGPRYAARQGGYTRILKLSKRRQGDGAEMAVMEYVDRPGELRAARPATGIQQGIMEEYIQETLGIQPIVGQDLDELEKELQELNMKGEGVEIVDAIEEPAAEEKPEETEKK